MAIGYIQMAENKAGNNGEVRRFRCIGYTQNNEKFFTVGNVYEEKDGLMISDTGHKYREVLGLPPHVWLSKWYNFVEITEDKKRKQTGKKYVVVLECEDSRITEATLYTNDRKVKTVYARRNPEDKFSLATGMKLALDRLLGKQ